MTRAAGTKEPDHAAVEEGDRKLVYVVCSSLTLLTAAGIGRELAHGLVGGTCYKSLCDPTTILNINYFSKHRVETVVFIMEVRRENPHQIQTPGLWGPDIETENPKWCY